MEKDRDEIIIKNAFKSMNIPETDIASAVHKKLTRKPAKSIKKSMIIALAALLILVTSVATVATGIGSFSRLTRILGADTAAGLIPIETESANGEFITQCGMRVEVVAIGLGYNMADIYIMLEDLTANRLQNGIILESSIYQNIAPSKIVMTPQIINRCETGVVTFHTRSWFETTGSLEHITVNIHRIQYNGVYYWWEHGVPVGGVSLGVDFSALPSPSETMFISEVYNTRLDINNNSYVGAETAPMVGWYATDNIGNMPPLPNTEWPEGTNIIAPGQTNYEITINNRIRSSISSVGVVDGTLRVLRRYESLPHPTGGAGDIASSFNSTRIFLQKQGPNPREVTEVFPLEMTKFMLYDGMVIQCAPFNSAYSWSGVPGISYVEYRFPVDESRLSYYRIAGLFTVYSPMAINWSVTVDVTEETHRYLMAEGPFHFNDDAVFTEVAVHTWGVAFRGLWDSKDLSSMCLEGFIADTSGLSATLNTTNGAIPLGFPMLTFVSGQEGIRDLHMTFLQYSSGRPGPGRPRPGDTSNINLLDIDLDTVISITVNGVTVYIQSA
ncbi:MAG: hypothetical protein FWC77_03445 [Defluviitaleaceae bacterium]|nr:hypothetical protein [Defluviitaleaceae bacterium]